MLAGTAVGEAVFSVDGAEVGQVELLCGTDVMPQVEPAINLLKMGLPG